MLKFLVGPGSNLHDLAGATLKERQAEVDNQIEVQKNTIASEQIKAETDPEKSLGKFRAFLSDNEIIKKRKKGQHPYTRDQLQSLIELEERAISTVKGVVKASFASNLRRSFLLALRPWTMTAMSVHRPLARET